MKIHVLPMNIEIIKIINYYDMRNHHIVSEFFSSILIVSLPYIVLSEFIKIIYHLLPSSVMDFSNFNFRVCFRIEQ